MSEEYKCCACGELATYCLGQVVKEQMHISPFCDVHYQAIIEDNADSGIICEAAPALKVTETEVSRL